MKTLPQPLRPRGRASRVKIICWAVFLLNGQSPAILGQEPKPDDPGLEQSIPGQAQADRKLPAWLKLGFELRGRADSYNEFDRQTTDTLYLNRLHLSLEVRPFTWLQLYFQAQDARVFGPNSKDDADLRDTVDVRQAFIELGRPEKGWQLRVGRQELSVGDERLVGSDNYWDSFGQTFDAVRVRFAGAKVRTDAFIGFVVDRVAQRPDPFNTGSRIAGLTVRFKTAGDGVLEPYFLWKRADRTRDLLERPGHRDVLTPGVRATGGLALNLDYNVEMALQRGHVVHDSISAWAGHWEIGWTPGKELGLRLSLEYNYASGDSNPGDRKLSTFDDLFPAGFNKFGLVDPIAWRNISYPVAGAELPVGKHWELYGAYRYYRLATTQDGLYPGGDEYLIRNSGATGSAVGSHALVSARYIPAGHWRFSGGYGYLFPGTFLRETGYRRPLRTAYLLFSFKF